MNSEFSRREVKPKTKQELIDGIVRLWETVCVEKCNKDINHLNKVIPRVIELRNRLLVCTSQFSITQLQCDALLQMYVYLHVCIVLYGNPMEFKISGNAAM